MRKVLTFLAIFLFLVYFKSISYAHKVNIFYYAEDNKMYLETYFSDGTKCRNSEILVYDNNANKLLLKGKTDKEGRFNFKIPDIPKNHTLKVVLNAEMGHRAEVLIKPSEWMEDNSDSDTTNESNNQNKSVSSAPKQQVSNSVNVQCDYKKFEKILDKKPTFNEIFGGIGYIFGLFGIILYFKSKK